MALRLSIEDVLSISAVSQRLGVPPSHLSICDLVESVGGLATGLNHVPFLSLAARMPDFQTQDLMNDQESSRPTLVRIAGPQTGAIVAPVGRAIALVRMAAMTGGPEAERLVESLSNEEITAAVNWISGQLRSGPKTYPQLRQGAPAEVLRPIQRGSERALHRESALQQVLAALERRGELVSTLSGGLNTSEGSYRYCLRQRMAPGSIPAADDALTALAEWYLHAYGPAGPRDFSAWSGLTEAASRRATGGARAALRVVEVAGMGEDFRVPESILDRRPLKEPVCFLIPWLDSWLHAYGGFERFDPEGREGALAQRDLILISVGPGVRHDATMAARVRVIGSAREPRFEPELWRPLAQHETEALEAGLARVEGLFG